MPDGSIDFRERNVVIGVAEGQQLGEVKPATKGQPGQNLFGDTQPAPDGIDHTFKAGDNVRAEGDPPHAFYAQVAGNAHVSGDTIHVKPIYIVNGDVNYETGNIDTPIDVQIGGSVRSGFTVKSGGTITIAGTVEANVVLSAHGDIIVAQGIIGENTAVTARGILSMGNVQTKFIQNASVLAKGNIEVGSYIFNSQVRCGGQIDVRSGGGKRGGSIVGGEIFAASAIGARLCGSESTAGDKLFFILFYVKCYPTVDVAGVLYRVHRSRPNRWVHAWLPALEEALGHKAVLPERKIHEVETFFARFPQAKDLFIDGTERPIRRPQEPAKEKRHFSGKKKRHTLTNLIASDTDRRILALSPTQPGTRHDYALLKDWPCPSRLPPDVVIWTDSGFQGIKTDYPQLTVIQPQKKIKGQPLDALDRFINTQKARIRLRVEHAIGGVKRYGALTQPYRNHRPHMDDQLMLVACGLWNLHLKEAE